MQTQICAHALSLRRVWLLFQPAFGHARMKHPILAALNSRTNTRTSCTRIRSHALHPETRELRGHHPRADENAFTISSDVRMIFRTSSLDAQHELCTRDDARITLSVCARSAGENRPRCGSTKRLKGEVKTLVYNTDRKEDTIPLIE